MWTLSLNRQLHRMPFFIAAEKKIQVTNRLQIENGSIIAIVINPKNAAISHECSEKKIQFVSFMRPILKASCAATVTGVVTYCALRLYNKDKAKKHQYSPIKWSLGAAVIVGAGTYWYAQ